MSALADFYDLLLPELPGCPTAMVDLHLREVAREFCSSTNVWAASLTPIDTVAGQATYALATPANSQLCRVTSLTLANDLLWKLEGRDVHSSSALRPQYQSDEPPFVLNGDLTAITLDTAPTAATVGGLRLEVTLKPTQTATSLPDLLLAQYAEAIRYGALARLMSMGKKPWTDRPLAAEYQQQWDTKKNFAAYQAQVGNTRATLRVKTWL